jgi:lipopolysaccharide transport system ATP-binding protein
MYVRLAFAVAAYLESEVLIVDEVLAVGDSEFQKKCLGRMRDVSTREGRTVLFVSHNMAAVKSLCNRGIMLKNGQVKFIGNQLETVQFYQNDLTLKSNFVHNGSLADSPGNEKVRILSVEVLPQEGEILSMFSGIYFKVVLFNNVPGINLDLTLEVSNIDDVVIFHNGTIITHASDSKQGYYTVILELPKQFLNSGIYQVSLIIGENQRYALFKVENIISFEVMQEVAGSNASRLPGITFPKLDISIEFSTKYDY